MYFFLFTWNRGRPASYEHWKHSDIIQKNTVIQALSDLRKRNSYFPEGPMQVEFCASWSRVYCVGTQQAVQLNSSCNTLENDGQLYDRPAVCIIAQKYSSATSSHCAFLPAKKYSARVSKMLLLDFLNYFQNCVNRKRRNLKLRKSGIVCNLRLSNST
jgi:hypothetical protein